MKNFKDSMSGIENAKFRHLAEEKKTEEPATPPGSAKVESSSQASQTQA